MLVFVVVTACILGTRNKFNVEGVGNAFADTPSVVSKTVTDKKYSRGGKTYTIYFDDDTFAHVNNYHYKGLESGDEDLADGITFTVTKDGSTTPIATFTYADLKAMTNSTWVSGELDLGTYTVSETNTNINGYKYGAI